MRKPVPGGLCSKIVLFTIILVFIAGCVPFLSPQKDLSPLDLAREQVQKIMDAYIIVYDRTMEMAEDPNITESKKVIVRTNKKVLQKVWLALLKCMRFLNEGKIPLSIDLNAADDILDLVEEVIT